MENNNTYLIWAVLEKNNIDNNYYNLLNMMMSQALD